MHHAPKSIDRAKFKKIHQRVGHPGVTDHDINEDALNTDLGTNLTSGPELDDRQRSSAKRELHEKGYVQKSSVYDTTVPEKPRLISNDRECEKPHVGSWGGVDRLEMTTCSEGASDVDEVLKGMTHSGGPRREGEGRRGGGGGGRDLGAAYGISADDNELALKEGVEGHQNAAD